MKRFIALLMTIIIVFSFAACGSSSGETASTGSSGGETSTGSGNEGRILQLGIGSEFSNIVPMSNNKALSNRDGLMIFAIYDPLLWFDTETSTLEPWICTDWTVSNDGLEYDLTIRDDVYFHNGTKLTADDVVFTLNLIPENPVVTTQNIPGFGHAEKIDDTHVKIYMEKPFVAVPNFLASYHLVMLSEDYYNEVGWEGYEEKPIGTGPFKFVERVIGSSMTLEANKEYWNGAPGVDGVKINIIPDANAQVLALENGEIDVLQNATIQNCERIEKIDGLNVSYCAGYLMCEAAFGSDGGLQTDENLRKAIISAVNIDKLVNDLNKGKVIGATCSLARGITDRPADGTFTPQMKYDLEAAKQYLAESNYDGSAFKIICVAGSKEELVCQVIQGNLNEIGINCELASVDGATFMTYYTTGDFGLTIYSSLPSLYDANLVYQGYDRTTSGFAVSQNPYKEELADLAEATLYEFDHAKRQDLFAQIYDIINGHGYSLSLYQDCNTMAYSDDVANIHAIPGTNYRIGEWTWVE